MEAVSLVSELYKYALKTIANISKEDGMLYLASNKVNCIYLVENLSSMIDAYGASAKESVTELYKNHLQERKLWAESFDEIRRVWDQQGVKSLFHKSCGEFPFMSDNLDVLVQVKDYKLAHKLLVENGYIELRSIQEPHKKFYRKFGDEKFYVPIHLHERVCWGVPYDDIDHLWAHSQVSAESEGVVFPSYDDAFITTIAHAFIEDHVFKIGDLIKVAMCLEHNLDWDYITSNIKSNKWYDAYAIALDCLNFLTEKMVGSYLVPESIMSKHRAVLDNKFNNKTTQLIKNKTFKMPYKLPHLRVRVYSSLRLINDNKLGGKVYNAFCAAMFLVDGVINLKLKFRNQPGYSVALSGGDGSGKTYFKEHLLKVLDTYGLTHEEVWMRYGSMPLTRMLNKTRKTIRKTDKTDNKLVAIKAPKRSKNALWLGLNLIDLLLFSIKYRLTTWLHRKVYVLDRNLLDFLVDYSVTSGNTIPRGFVQILRFMFPKVDYGILISGGVVPQASLEGEDRELQYTYYSHYLACFPQFERVENKMDYQSCDKFAAKVVRNVFGMYPEKYKKYLTTSIKYK